MKHKILLVYTWLIRTLLYFLPDHPVIMRIRGLMYGFALQSCGKDFQVSASVILRNLENISVGSHVYFAPNVIVNAIDKINLSSEVMIGFNSVLVSGNHSVINGSYRFGKSKHAPILIGEGAWVAANCTITAGTRIGASVLIAANSMARGDCSIRGVYAGAPAKLIEEKKKVEN